MTATTDFYAFFEARVRVDGDCLVWTGAISNGHPSCKVNGRQSTVRRRQHELLHGPIPAGKVLRMTCGNKLCVRDAHCKVATRQQVAKECGALGLMSGLLRTARIAEVKRASSQAKITQADAQAIRRSEEPASAVAARYGLSASSIHRIRRGEVRREFAGNVWAGLGA